MSESPDLPGDLLALAREDLASAEALDKADRLTPYAAAIRYGLGNPKRSPPRVRFVGPRGQSSGVMPRFTSRETTG